MLGTGVDAFLLARWVPVTVETGTEATATTIVLSFKLMSMYNETKTVLVC